MTTRTNDHARRAAALDALADRLEAEKETVVQTLVRELEVTVRSARTREVELPLRFLRALGARNLPAILAEQELALADRTGYGTAAIVLPYNAIGIAASCTVGAAYLGGNDVLLRLPSRVPELSGIYRRLIESTLDGVTVTDETGPSFLERCFEDERVGLLCLFGDDRWFVPSGPSPVRGGVGPNYRELARRTGTKVIFEGPGKDPFVVFAGADLDRAADGAVASAYVNAGQSCSSPERFYVEASVLDAFVERVVARTKRIRVGPPESEETDLGPIGSAPVRERIRAQFLDARERGARFLTGGEIVEVKGCRFPTCLPTVVVDCTQDMLLFREETFGPVIPVMPFETEEEALRLVDDCRYGLTATVYGGSARFRAALERTHGNVFFDSCIVDPEHAGCRLFWGGFRNSGWIWEWQGKNFVHREGPRRLLAEFTRPGR